MYRKSQYDLSLDINRIVRYNCGMKKIATSFRLSSKGLARLRLIAQAQETTQSAIIEWLLDAAARRSGVKPVDVEEEVLRMAQDRKEKVHE